jgi:hypothetical protein
MGKLTPSLAAETEALREAYAALNRNDIPATIKVLVYVRVRLKHETEWREGRQADVYTFRNGKAIQMRVFADRQQALEWAGVKASDAN